MGQGEGRDSHRWSEHSHVRAYKLAGRTLVRVTLPVTCTVNINTKFSSLLRSFPFSSFKLVTVRTLGGVCKHSYSGCQATLPTQVDMAGGINSIV